MGAIKPGSSGGGGGASLPDTPENVLADASRPDTITGLNASGVGVSLYSADVLERLLTTIDDMTGSSWTDYAPASGAATAWDGGELVMTIPDGVAVAAATGVHRDDGTSGDTYDVLVRVDVVAGDGANAANVNVACGTSSADAIYFVMNLDGRLIAGRNRTGIGWTQLGTTSGPSSPQRTAGALWLRFSRRPDVIRMSWGIATDPSRPASTWNEWFSTNDATNVGLARGRYVHIRCDALGGGVSGGLEVHVTSIRTSTGGLSL